MTYTANYPPAQSSTYVKASSYIGGFDPFYATDPALSLTGDCTGTSWLSATTAAAKIVVDFGSAVTFDRLYLDNYHHYGGYTTRGIYQFRLYGSNSSEALTRYANSTDLTDLTLIGSYTAAEHVASDTSDPQYFVLDGNDYQYAVLIIDTNYGGVYHGIRHFEIQSEDAEELVTLEIGWKHVWDVMDALESGWEHNWTNIWQNVERGFDHSWNCIIEQGWQHKWGELPVLERGWDHRWGCLHVLTQGWAHNWQTLKTFEGGFEHTWNDLLSIETGWQHTWDGLNAPIETGWQHVWDVKETTTLERGWCHTWVVCGENVDNEFVIKCTLKGQPISCTDIQLEGSRTDCSISLDGSLPEYIERIHGRALPLDIGKLAAAEKAAALAASYMLLTVNGEDYHTLAVSISPTLGKGESTLAVKAESPVCLLKQRFAGTLTESYGPGNIKEIAEGIVTAAGYTLSWQTINWYIPKGVLYANNESPLQVLQKITSAIGARIHSFVDGTFAIKPYCPVTWPNIQNAVAALTLSIGGNFLEVTERDLERSGYNSFTISDQMAGGKNLIYEEEDLQRGVKEIRAYPNPWDDDGLALATSGSKDRVIIQAPQEVIGRVDDEVVELIQGVGTTTKPIHQIISRDYGDNTQLGAISISPAGGVKSEIVGQSMVTLSYYTHYWKWRVLDDADEMVQLYTWPAWSDVPLTLVVTFGDVAAADGFCIFEPDDTRNIDDDGNVLSVLPPGMPYGFQGQLDETLKISEILTSSGIVKSNGSITREKVQELQFIDGSSVELSYIPTSGGIEMDWDGRTPSLDIDGRKVKPSAYPAIGDATYHAKMLGFTLTPPDLSDLPEDEEYRILIAINVVSK